MVLYLASVAQRLRLQLYDLNYGAIQIILLTYLLKSDVHSMPINVLLKFCFYYFQQLHAIWTFSSPDNPFSTFKTYLKFYLQTKSYAD